MSSKIDLDLIDILNYSIMILIIGIFIIFHGIGVGIFMFLNYDLKDLVLEIMTYTRIFI